MRVFFRSEAAQRAVAALESQATSPLRLSGVFPVELHTRLVSRDAIVSRDQVLPHEVVEAHHLMVRSRKERLLHGVRAGRRPILDRGRRTVGRVEAYLSASSQAL
jgi:hypothetical protein